MQCSAVQCSAVQCKAGPNYPNWIRPGQFVCVNWTKAKGTLRLRDDTWKQTVLPLYCEGAVVPMSLLWLSVAGRLVLSVEQQSQWKYIETSGTTKTCLVLEIRVIYSCNSTVIVTLTAPVSFYNSGAKKSLGVIINEDKQDLSPAHGTAKHLWWKSNFK